MDKFTPPSSFKYDLVARKKPAPNCPANAAVVAPGPAAPGMISLDQATLLALIARVQAPVAPAGIEPPHVMVPMTPAAPPRSASPPYTTDPHDAYGGIHGYLTYCPMGADARIDTEALLASNYIHDFRLLKHSDRAVLRGYGLEDHIITALLTNVDKYADVCRERSL